MRQALREMKGAMGDPDAWCRTAPQLRQLTDDWFYKTSASCETHRCKPAACAVQVRALASARRVVFSLTTELHG